MRKLNTRMPSDVWLRHSRRIAADKGGFLSATDRRCFFSLVLSLAYPPTAIMAGPLMDRGVPSRPRRVLGMRCSAVLPSQLSPQPGGRFGNLEPNWAVNLVQPRHHAVHIHLALIYTRAVVGPRATHEFNRSEVTRGMAFIHQVC